MRAFGASGVTMPSPDKLTIYYKREALRDLISKDLNVKERHKQGDKLLKSLAHATGMIDTWERFKLNPLYEVEYILYGNCGLLGYSYDGVPVVFDINKNGAFMLVKFTTYLDCVAPEELRVSDIMDLNAVFLAEELFMDLGIERCGETVSKGYPTVYMILPRTYQIPDPYIKS